MSFILAEDFSPLEQTCSYILEKYKRSGEDITQEMWISAVGYARIPHTMEYEGVPIRYFKALKLNTLFKVIVTGAILSTKEKRSPGDFVSEKSAGLPHKMPQSFYTKLSREAGINLTGEKNIEFSSNVYAHLPWNRYKIRYFQTQLLSSSLELEKGPGFKPLGE